MVDCRYILLEKSAASSDIIAACINASATIRGSKIQLWNLLTGFLALAAGLFTIYAARIQIKPVIAKNAAEKQAYIKNIVVVTSYVISNCELIMHQLEIAEDTLRFCPEYAIMLRRVNIPEEYSPTEWRSHAILGESALEQIINLRRLIQFLNNSLDLTHNVTLNEFYKKTVYRTDYRDRKSSDYSILSQSDLIGKELYNCREYAIALQVHLGTTDYPLTKIISTSHQI